MIATETKTETAMQANRMASPGTIFNIRLSASQTNGAISVINYECLPGSEPFLHVHTLEDETFIVEEGSVTFCIGDKTGKAFPGDVFFLPRNIPHSFKVTSEKLKGTVILTPGNLENFFRQASTPYKGVEIPPVTTPTEEQIQGFLNLAISYGMQLVAVATAGQTV